MINRIREAAHNNGGLWCIYAIFLAVIWQSFVLSGLRGGIITAAILGFIAYVSHREDD